MPNTIKDILRDAIPPILWRGASACVHRWNLCTPPRGTQRDAAYYDRLYRVAADYRAHYTSSRYFFLWSVLIDRMLRSGVASVLDVGCGTGQFAAMARDRGLKAYCGIDFSRQAVERARSVCPEFRFEAANAMETDLFDALPYDAVTCLEFLEHVEHDREVLRRIPAGRRFYGSVPNFPDPAHVRHFSGLSEVRDRYADFFRDFHVDAFLATEEGITYYLFEGVTKDQP